MLHTPLHLALGEPPGPMTDRMIDDAVTQGVEENDALDWKTKLPSEKDFRDSDIVKDIAAFANAGGGIIVFGVSDKNKAADERHDAGDLTENYERTIRQVCMAAITPPLFGVQAIAIPTATTSRAVALIIPASPDGPHLVYKNDYFGAPNRTGADTAWMKERQLEAAYRTRFDGQRQGEESLRRIYDDMASVAGKTERAVLVGAARPRSRSLRRGKFDAVPAVVDSAKSMARWWLARAGTYNPLEDIDPYRGRPTLAGQYLPPSDPGDVREGHAVLFDDGSLGMSWRAGGHERDGSGRHRDPHQVGTLAVEGFVAALMALVHAVAAENPTGDYDVIFGVELETPAGLTPEFHVRKAAPPSGVYKPFSGRFRPISATVDPSVSDEVFIASAITLATAALNQVGIASPTLLDDMLPPRRKTGG